MGRPTIKYLSPEEIDSILKATLSPVNDIRSRAILTLSYYAGLRASEVGLIRLGDLRLEAKRIYIHRLKGSISGEHTLSPPELKVLREWMKERIKRKWMKKGGDYLFPSFHRDNKGVSRTSIFRIMKRYGERAGLPASKCFPHALKHSICMHLLDSGEQILAIQDWVGHRRITSTAEYLKLSDKQKKETEERFYGKRCK